VLALVVEDAMDRPDPLAAGGVDGDAARQREVADRVPVVLHAVAI
jgi:hypothetical protein